MGGQVTGWGGKRQGGGQATGWGAGGKRGHRWRWWYGGDTWVGARDAWVRDRKAWLGGGMREWGPECVGGGGTCVVVVGDLEPKPPDLARLGAAEL